VTSEAFAPSVHAGRPSWSSEAEVVVDCVEVRSHCCYYLFCSFRREK